VRFEVEHRFAVTIGAVEAAMTDPDFSAQLQLPGVAPLQVVDRREDGDVVSMNIAYEFTEQLPAVARGILGSGRLRWVQATVIDRARHRGEFTIVPGSHADRLSCGGSYLFRPVTDSTEAKGTVRTITGELTVRVPLLGGRAERAITSGLIERLDVEADALATWLASGH
jgi:hypothetical protein